MSDLTVLARSYIILCPEAIASDLQDALDALPEAVLQSRTFQIVEGLGPEAAPDAGVSAIVTHRLDAPLDSDGLFAAVRDEVLAMDGGVRRWPGSYVHDMRWWVLDGDETRVVYTDEQDPRTALALFQHDPVW